MNNLRQKYIDFFTTLIDRALSGEEAVAYFCDGVVLRLYQEDGELHWGEVDATNTGRPIDVDG